MSTPTASGLREAKKRATARELAIAAYTLVRERGYDAVTIDDIAADAGYSRRTFANHYAGKPEAVVDGFLAHAAVLTDLDGIDAGLNHGLEPVATELERFGDYAQLHRQALVKVRGGHPEWLDSPAVESCQLIWIQLHEDLLATLGIPRGSDTVAPE